MAVNRKTGGPSIRTLRTGENLRHALSEILTRVDINDDDLKGVAVTVSEVRISPDLRNATVYIMPLSGKDQVTVVKALNRHSTFVRGELSRRVTMKYMPRLAFRIDESFDEASRIDAILHDPRVRRDLEAGEDGEE